MSFILDALKKSEERRNLQAAGAESRRRSLYLAWPGARRWPYWLLLAVLPLALASGWWLRGASVSATGSDDVPSAAVSAQPVQDPPVPAAVVAAPPEVGPRPAPYAPVPFAQAGSEVPAAAPAPRRPVPPPAQRQPASGATAVPRVDSLSGLTMSLHFYADNPAQRMVRIDNRILREGQSLGDGMVLEEITPTGAIFSASGKRLEVVRPGGQP